MLFKCCNELVGIGVNSEIDYFEACAFHHHGNQVLANVMNVALHGSYNNFAN